VPVEDASRGSTVQEREAALAWLEHAARDEHQVARVQAARPPAGRTPTGARLSPHPHRGSPQQLRDIQDSGLGLPACY
jgi:hypothetical protein